MVTDESNSNSKNTLEYKVYLEERKLLVDAKREGARSFDKAILTLAAGAFGLSLTFIRQIVPNAGPDYMFCLILAWSGFCVSLLSTLISFLASQYACSRQIEILDEVYIDNQSEQDRKVKLKNEPAIWTRRLNILSICAFIVGVIFLATFSIVNL